MPVRDAAVGGELHSIGSAEARSALAWWLAAGVDTAIQEEPRNWLKPRAQPPAVRRQGLSPPETPNVVRPSHETLAELQEWLARSAELPLASMSAKRILPRGPENAPIMLLSDVPTFDDYAAGQPIGGDAWVLAQRMLAAIGLGAEQAYCASLSPIHAPGARLSGSDRADVAEMARNHVRLAKPQRLLLFGDGPCQALLAKPVAEARGHLHKIEGVRTVATFSPRFLINHPSKKSMAWQDLLLLMEDES
jgi:uracil-DNA glycosylase family 4